MKDCLCGGNGTPLCIEDIEVGDLVGIVGGIFTTVDYIGDGYIHSNEYGECFRLHQIDGVYMKVWQKGE